MNNVTELLNLLRRGYTFDEVSQMLDISLKKLSYYFNISEQKKGIFKKGYSNGAISYDTLNKSNVLITDKEENKIKFMVISDQHFGSCHDNVNLINLIYDYAVKNNIHIILNLGDLLDGNVGPDKKKVIPPKQVEYMLKNYPYEKNIINYLLLGNHDYNVISDYGINIMGTIDKNRFDFINVGCGEGSLIIKNDQLILQHPLPNNKDIQMGNYNKNIILRGHGHQAKVYEDNNNLYLYVPSLSDLNFNKVKFPGSLVLTIKMKDGLIQSILVEELTYFNKAFNITSELDLSINKDKKNKKNLEIENEEDFEKVFVKK